MSNVLTHRFVSPKLDGPDATQVQPSAWNDGHRFSGGTDGQVLTRSTADATFGAVWGPRTQEYTVLAPSLAAGSYHDWNPGVVGSTLIFIQTGGTVTLTGIKPAATPYAGQVIRLVLAAGVPGQLVLLHENAGSSTGSQIRTRPTATVTIAGYWGFVDLLYGPVLGGAWLVGAYGNGHGG